MNRVVVTISMLAAVCPVHARAQSLLSAGGLGTPLEALDGRSRAMGSVGVGLFGAAVLPSDPANAQALTVPMLSISLQPTTGTATRSGVDTPIEGTRFPLLALAYPVGTLGVATLSYGGFLDQRWKAESTNPLVLAGESVDATDTFESSGGVAVVRFGFARNMTERLAIAVSAGRYTGRQIRTFTRDLDAEQLGATVAPFVTRGRWTMSGHTFSLGARWDPVSFLRVSGSMAMSGDLHATPTGDTEGGDRAFGLPTELRVGASASLTPVVIATFGLTRADWSGTDFQLEGAQAAGTVMSIGGGLEWSGNTFAGRGFPIRLGYRRTELPFAIGSADPVESVFAAGFGWNLIETETLLVAAIDFAYERGSRDAGTLSEEFTRYTLSFRVASF